MTSDGQRCVDRFREFLATVNEQIKECLTAFTCGPCRREFGSERRAGVLVIVQEPGKEPGVIPFCYRHAGTYVSRWTEPTVVPSVLLALSELGHAALALRRALSRAVFRHFQRA